MVDTNKKIKVCMIVFNDFIRDARVTKEAETLVRAGMDVTVVALHRPGVNQRKEMHPSGFKVIRVKRGLGLVGRGIPYVDRLFQMIKERFKSSKLSLPIFALYTILTLGRVVFVCWRVGAKAYHAHDLDPLPVAWLVSRLRRAQLIYDSHEINTHSEGSKHFRWLLKPLERWLVCRVNAMITTTDARSDFFAGEYNIPRPLVLQNRPRFTPFQRSNRIRERLGLKDQRPIVLYQGGIQRGRGMHNIVRVALKVPEACFVLIGEGQLADEIRSFITELNVQNRVYMLPFVPLVELQSYTMSANIGLQVIQNTCLNHYTTDSNKLFEYIMAGLPVVASDFPEIRRIVNDYNVGLLINPDSVDDIAAKVRTLITDHDLYAALSENALSASTKLSWESQEHRLLQDVYGAFA